MIVANHPRGFVTEGLTVMKLKLSTAFVAGWMSALSLGGPAIAASVGFDNYVSPTNNDLVNNFNQTGTISTQTPYVQSPTGGISGGSVTGYSGSEYRATAVYNQSSFTLSTPGASVLLSIDMWEPRTILAFGDYCLG